MAYGRGLFLLRRLQLHESLADGLCLKSCQTNVTAAKDRVRRQVLRPAQDVWPTDFRIQNNPLIVLICMVTQPGFDLVGSTHYPYTPINFPTRI